MPKFKYIKKRPPIAEEIADQCLYEITHLIIPPTIKDIEAIIRRKGTIFTPRSAEKERYRQIVKRKIHDYFITNQNHD